MARVADQDQRASRCHILTALHMNLGNERAGGVQHVEVAFLRGHLDALCHAVRAENGHGAVRHLIEFLDETCALVAQIFNHMPVVDDFVAHVDGCAMFLQGAVDNFDRANDPRTKAAGLGKDDSHRVANSD